MPIVYRTYWQNGKDWCHCCGTRPRYCGNGCRSYVKTPPKSEPTESVLSLKKIKQLQDQLSLKDKQLKEKDKQLQEADKKSQLSYSSISTKNAERNRQRFTCSLTAEIMSHPFDLPCGHCFEERAIKDWLKKNGTCPMCRQEYQEKDLRRNLMCQQSIQQFLEKIKRKEEKQRLGIKK